MKAHADFDHAFVFLMSHQKRHANQVGSDQRDRPLIVWEIMEKRNNIKNEGQKLGVLSLWKDRLRAVCVR